MSGWPKRCTGQTIPFSDLWNSVVSAFVSSKEEEVALVPTPKKRPEVVVLFLSSEVGLCLVSLV